MNITSNSTDCDSRLLSRNNIDLKKAAIRGGVATVAAQIIGTLIHLVSTIILARLLTPGDYGVMSMALSITTFANLFRDMGLSSAAIQAKDMSHEQQSSLFWINVVVGCLLTCLVALSSPVVAWFFKKPDLALVVFALSFNFLISSLGTQPSAALIREMKFGLKSMAHILGSVAGLLVSVTLAIKGLSFWSLTWGSLAGGLATSIFLISFSNFRPGKYLNDCGVKGMLKFGADLTGYNFVNYFSRNLDSILIGKFWGPEELGIYSRAYSLLMFPISNLREPINSVAFPVLSKLQNEPELFRAYYKKIVSLLALTSMPLSACMSISSPELIQIVLGSQWQDVTNIFTVLSMVSFVQPVVTTWGIVTMSLGLSSRYFHLGIFNTVVTVIGFGIGLPWGVPGVTLSYVFSTYLLLVPTLQVAFNKTPVKIADFFNSVATPAIASTVSVAVAFIARQNMMEFCNLYRLIFTGAVFVAAYLVTFITLSDGRRILKPYVTMINKVIVKKIFR